MVGEEPGEGRDRGGHGRLGVVVVGLGDDERTGRARPDRAGMALPPAPAARRDHAVSVVGLGSPDLSSSALGRGVSAEADEDDDDDEVLLWLQIPRRAGISADQGRVEDLEDLEQDRPVVR